MTLGIPIVCPTLQIFASTSKPTEPNRAPRHSVSLGIRPGSPLHRHSRCVHSQHPKMPSAQRCNTPGPVPPSWILTTSTVCSATELQVCCALQPVMGFVAFRVRAPQPPAEADGESRERSRYALPFEEFPSPTAAPRHRGRCLPGVTLSQRPTRERVVRAGRSQRALRDRGPKNSHP